MENVLYQIKKGKETLRGAMAALSSEELQPWERKEFEQVRRDSIRGIREWIQIKKELSSSSVKSAVRQ
jgi:hypothetical protein